MDFIAEFLAAMAASGCATADPILPDDKVHRFHVHGDKPHKQNGTYQLAIEGNFAFGWWIDHKEGVTHKWHSKAANMSPEQTAALKKKIDERRAAAERDRKAAAAAARRKAEGLWARAAAECPAGGYLAKKGVKAHGVRSLHGLILVPAWKAGQIMTMQFISPSGEKKYLTHGQKNGAWFTIPGRPDKVAICEGYATGASIYEATGYTVEIVFDSGNLKASAAAIRAKHPEAEIILAADFDAWVFRSGAKPKDWPDPAPAGNDEIWTQARKAGLLWNPGLEAAEAALKKVGGAARIVTPKFENTAPRPTDFNDLHAAQGLAEVARQITAVEVAREEINPYPEAPPISAEEFADDIARGLPHYDPDSISSPVETGPFKIMGHNLGVYYYLPRGSGQIVELTASAHSKNNLMQLADLEFWKERCGGPKGAISWDMAANALIQLSQRRGIFKPDTMVRGAGVWRDAGRIVVHCGDKLLVDGVETDPFMIGSKYVYQASTRVFEIAKDPLSNLEAYQLRKICECATWDNPLSAILFAGWIVVAPVCAALDWRPHIWLTGESQAGKSYMMKKVLAKMLNTVAISVESGTSEAGLRRLIGCDGRPVVMDEMESETERDQITTQDILMLARKASTGGTIVKADTSGQGARSFGIYSSFCFSSINPAVKQRADESRVSLLSLRRNRSANAAAEFNDLKVRVRELLTDEYARRMLTRTIQNINVLVKNSEIFTDAAAEILKDQRAADQIGPMLAGAYLLNSSEEIGREKAKEWIGGHDWNRHTAIGEQSDHERLFDRIFTSRVIVQGRVARYETQIGMAVQRALGYIDADFTAQEAITALKNIDIRIKDKWVAVRKPSQHIERVLRGTPWVANWARTILNCGGTQLTESPTRYGKTTAHAVLIMAERFKPEEVLI